VRLSVAKKADIIDQYVDPHAGDIFRTAFSVYPSFSSRFGAIALQLNSEMPGFVYYGEPDGEAFISIGELDDSAREGAVSPFVFERLNRRFGIDRSVLTDKTNKPYILRWCALAHELGHLIQDEPAQMQLFFGQEIDRDNIVHDVRSFDDPAIYLEYVNSPREVHADYVASTILANSVVGAIIGVSLPNQTTNEWGLWADDRLLTNYDLDY